MPAGPQDFAMPEATDMSRFLRHLGDELRKLGSHRPPQDHERIYRQFRSRTPIDAARQFCGDGARRFEVEKEERQRFEGTFSRNEPRLIRENILGANILIDGVPLPGFFWWEEGKAFLIPAPPRASLVFEHAEMSSPPQTAQIIDFPATRAEVASLSDLPEVVEADPAEMKTARFEQTEVAQIDARQEREGEALRRAMAWARQGYAVFPLRVGRAVPLTANGMHDATSDLPTVKDWWSEDYRGANIGVATGATSGCVVIAVEEMEGITALETLAREALTRLL